MEKKKKKFSWETESPSKRFQFPYGEYSWRPNYAKEHVHITGTLDFSKMSRPPSIRSEPPEPSENILT